jgi:hypothetical protein
VDNPEGNNTAARHHTVKRHAWTQYSVSTYWM